MRDRILIQKFVDGLRVIKETGEKRQLTSEVFRADVGWNDQGKKERCMYIRKEVQIQVPAVDEGELCRNSNKMVLKERPLL